MTHIGENSCFRAPSQGRETSYYFDFGRFIICTSAKTVKGEKRRLKISLKQKENYNLPISQLNRSQICLKSLGVGALLIMGILVGPFEIPQAHAASSLDSNLGLAKEAIKNVTPGSLNKIDSGKDPIVLAPEGFLPKPLVAETQITVAKVTIKPLPKSSISTKTAVVKVKLVNDGRNHFAYGYCTYYVASRRNIPWFGNAGTWLSGAKAAGFATGVTPQVGAIIVTSESRLGHVGIVEAVNYDGTITISEMNYSGFARITTRTIPTSYGAIKGYIY